MRPFSAIEDEIAAKKKKIKKLEKQKNDAKYKDVSLDVGKGVRAYIWGSIASFCVFVYKALLLDSQKHHELAIVFAIIGGFFMLFSLIAIIGYLKGDIAHKAATGFTVFGVIVSIISAGELLGGLSLISLPFQLFINNADVAKIVGLSLDNLNEATVYYNGVFVAVATIMLIGSIIKLAVETHKKKGCQLKQEELTNEIASYEETMNVLNNELENTKTEAQKAFEDERSKNDRAQIEKLAKIGVEDAKTWIKEDDRRIGKEIFDEEIKKDKPDQKKIEKASALGCPEASVYCGEALLNVEGAYTKEEQKDLLLQAQEYFKKAKGVGLCDGDFYYLYVKSKTEEFYEEEWKELLKKFRKFKESGLLGEKAAELCDIRIETCVDTLDWIREQEKKRFHHSSSVGTNSNSSEKPLTDSELSQLNQTICLGLYNPGAIDRFPGLSASQKEQLKRYNKIYGD